ncbi:rhomboid family protein [Thermodesulfobacteriota bacterium]
MNDTLHQRCRNHQFREAAARCPECGRYFCRECVTEHDDRVLCTSCLKNNLKASPLRSFRFGSVIRILQLLSGTMIVWLFFYYFGQLLLSLPSSFHDGEIWSRGG